MHRYGMGGFNALHDRTDDFKDQFPHYYVRFTFLWYYSCVIDVERVRVLVTVFPALAC